MTDDSLPPPTYAEPPRVRHAPLPSPFLDALRMKWRGIYALMFRDAKLQYRENRLGYLWALFDPLVQMVMLVALFELVKRQAPFDMDAPTFLVIGLTNFRAFRNVANAAALRPSETSLAMPQISVLDVKVAAALRQAITYFIVLLVMLVGLQVAGFHNAVDNPAAFVACYALIAAYGLAFGLIVGALSLAFPIIQKFLVVLFRVLYFSSGLFYVTEELPRFVTDYLLWNPILHLNLLARSEFFLSYQTIDGSFAYVLLVLPVLLFLGLMAERALRALNVRPLS